MIDAMQYDTMARLLPADFPPDREGRDVACTALLNRHGNVVHLLARGDSPRERRLRSFFEQL
jgi:hypothetical protein